MVIKKYRATSEKEAIELAKADLGPDAIVMNVKSIKPGGLFRIFKKTKIELTAAIDENMEKEKKIAVKTAEKKQSESEKESDSFVKGFASAKKESEEEAANAIEEKINSIAKLLEAQMSTAREKAETERKEALLSGHTEKSEEGKKEEKEKEEKPAEAPQENKVANLIRKQLLENDVREEYVDAILKEAGVTDDKQQLDNLLAGVYQKIVLKLGKIEPITPSEKVPKLLFFVGNTGVGKTTTIAKLASRLRLLEKKKIAVISVDTYRIAAIEQMKTYTGILKVPFSVVYSSEEMRTELEKYKENDYILIDTAGRSHKNAEQRKDLMDVFASAEGYESQVYLVLSAAVRYRDLMDMAKAYGELFDYKFIFTKLDETNGHGTILNLKLDTGKDLSYVTWGQNVPEDIGLLDPQVVAKKLLGGAQHD